MRKLKFEYLPLDKIDISLSNVRKSNLEEDIDEITNSIKEIGVQQPIVVSQKGGLKSLTQYSSATATKIWLWPMS